MSYTNTWTEVEPGFGATARFRRSDGAEVWESSNTYHSNPMNPRCRLWEAAGPGPRDYLNTAQRRLNGGRQMTMRVRRRFGSAAAAMRAVETAYPLKTRP